MNAEVKRMSKAYYYIKQALFYLFIVLYACLLAKALLFKEVSMLEVFSAGRGEITRAYNFIPFKTIYEYFATRFNIWIALMNVVGNIALFVPLGMYLQVFRKRKKILPCVALACAISVGVEILQFILGIGAADIDDVLLNTLGALLGILLYRVIYAAVKDEGKAKNAITLLWCAAGGLVLLLLCITHFAGLKVRIF